MVVGIHEQVEGTCQKVGAPYSVTRTKERPNDYRKGGMQRLCGYRLLVCSPHVKLFSRDSLFILLGIDYHQYLILHMIPEFRFVSRWIIHILMALSNCTWIFTYVLCSKSRTWTSNLRSHSRVIHPTA